MVYFIGKGKKHEGIGAVSGKFRVSFVYVHEMADNLLQEQLLLVILLYTLLLGRQRDKSRG
jgi:hypothetical protein